MTIQEAIEIWKEDYELHYKPYTKKTATKGFLKQKEALNLILAHAEQYQNCGKEDK